MNKRTLILLVIVGIGGAGIGAILTAAILLPRIRAAASPEVQLWTCGMHPRVIQDYPGTCPICHMDLTPVKVEGPPGSAPAPGTQSPAAQRQIRYWWDPMMSPPYISERPGKSPMGMDLVPVYEDQVSGGAAVVIDPVVVQNMGVRLEPVSAGPLRRSIRAVGYLDEAQPNIRDINLRVSGWIRHLHADSEGMALERGAPLFDLYSPELRIAIEELIASRRAREVGADDSARTSAQMLYDAAATKLELMDLPREQVAGLAALDHAPQTVTFYSPLAGELVEKPVVEGAAVTAGQRVLRIVDHSTLWLDAQVFEKDLPFVAVGQKVQASVDSRPGETIEGDVFFIHPHVNMMTRAATVRVALPNPDMHLRPGMYATVHIDAPIAERAVMVPREAVIDTGERQVAFVSLGSGHFEPRRVVMGHPADGGMVQVLEGLAPGEIVVVSAQFLLDSESRMVEATRKFLDERKQASPKEAPASGPPEAPPGHDHAAPAAAHPQVDAVVAGYLRLADALGAPQTSDAPLDAGALVEAAHQLHGAVAGSDSEALSAAVAAAAQAMAGQPLDRQRELFKALSDAVIAVLGRHPPSPQVAERLYVMFCPMAPGRWVQAVEQVNNPYYATSMKRCGELVKTITPAPAALPEAEGGGRP